MSEPAALTDEAAFVRAVNEQGDRAVAYANAALAEWTEWADRLDALVRRLPALPRLQYLDDCGEATSVPLLIGSYVTDMITSKSAQALQLADAVTCELRRHGRLVAEGSAATLRELGVTAGEAGR